jgi:hypothetical protein
MFIARLFGFVVVLVFLGAMGLSLMSNVEMPSLKSSSVEESAEAIAEVSLPSSVEVPSYFRSESRSDLREVKINSLVNLKEVIYREGSVVVMLDNETLKNPFIPNTGLFKVVLNGFNDTHLFSTGAEVGDNSFVYLNADFMSAFESAGSLAWILN